MPTYEYLCQSCGHRFEAWQHITDDPLTVCPNCGGPIHRVLFPAGIVFKGSGFYKTDSTHSSAAAVPPAETAPAETSTSTSAAKSDGAGESSTSTTSSGDSTAAKSAS